MSKMPVAWHKENLKNMSISLKQGEAVLQAQQNRIDSLRTCIDLLRLQIGEAIKRDVASFDADKFLKKRIRKKEKT